MKYKFLLIIVTECYLEKKIRFFRFLEGDANRNKSKHGIKVNL